MLWQRETKVRPCWDLNDKNLCLFTYFSPWWTNSSFDVGMHFHLDLFARLSHVFQHVYSVFVLAAHHQLLQSN